MPTEYHHRFLGDGEGANKLSDETLQALKMRAVYYNPQWPEKIKVCSFHINEIWYE